MLRNFRCFSAVDLEFSGPVVLIHGPNGSGKTSILEALHYACYLKSFKTHLPRELMKAKTDGFGINVGIASQGYDTLHVMMSGAKKTVKLNDKSISSYKELYSAYKVVTITEDDLEMIQGGPSLRRTFLDHMALLLNPEYALLAKKYRIILDNRNALLARQKKDDDSYHLWTDQLLIYSHAMQAERKKMIELLREQSKELISLLSLDEESITLSYDYAKPYTDIENTLSTSDLLIRYPSLIGHEMGYKRSLIGAHLDDFSITFQGKASRAYASRGQQKMLLFILKLASIKCLTSEAPGVILLVDDFMTDFDEARAQSLMPLLTGLPSQLIVTSPGESFVKHMLSGHKTQTINLQEAARPRDKNKIYGLDVMG
jgi:DNA replication and repair protein RecF